MRFADVKPGEHFKHKGKVYVKLEVMRIIPDGIVNAKQMGTVNYVWFDSEEEVEYGAGVRPHL